MRSCRSPSDIIASVGTRFCASVFDADITALESRLQPDQAFPAGCLGPGRHSTGSSRDSRSFSIRTMFATFFSRSRRSQRYTPAPAGIPPAKAGTPGHSHIRNIFSTFISRFSTASATTVGCILCTVLLPHSIPTVCSQPSSAGFLLPRHAAGGRIATALQIQTTMQQTVDDGTIADKPATANTGHGMDNPH